ncbi:hypothetical protein Taro_022599, partial [Colocasia esculenta]|nr:hypothetical protein [Colocasia esculenta]
DDICSGASSSVYRRRLYRQFPASKATPTSFKESDGYAGMQSPARGAGGHKDDLSETEVAGSRWGKASEQLREIYRRIPCSDLLLYSSALGGPNGPPLKEGERSVAGADEGLQDQKGLQGVSVEKLREPSVPKSGRTVKRWQERKGRVGRVPKARVVHLRRLLGSCAAIAPDHGETHYAVPLTAMVSEEPLSIVGHGGVEQGLVACSVGLFGA